jgi:hypothetical protein
MPLFRIGSGAGRRSRLGILLGIALAGQLLSCDPLDVGGPAGGQIIADHTVVDRYADIPQEYIDTVKTWLVDAAGESHSAAYRDGMISLEGTDGRFDAQTFTSGFPASAGALRLGSHDSVGEEDFWTNAAAIANIKSIISDQHDSGNPINVIFQAWCWDFTVGSTAGAGGTNARDPEYHCRWYGSTVGGPDDDHIWGLDDADSAITGNSLSLSSYLETVEEYRSYCRANGYVCEPVFSTGPVDGNNGSNQEIGYQREVKHDYIRNYVKGDADRVLFDYADIMCYNDDDEPAEFTWSDGGTPRTFRGIHPDNTLGAETGHIGSVGAVRLAKAMWWMLARMAGWDGR